MLTLEGICTECGAKLPLTEYNIENPPRCGACGHVFLPEEFLPKQYWGNKNSVVNKGNTADGGMKDTTADGATPEDILFRYELKCLNEGIAALIKALVRAESVIAGIEEMPANRKNICGILGELRLLADAQKVMGGQIDTCTSNLIKRFEEEKDKALYRIRHPKRQ